ncbi:class I SAM-dependent methyltransferase [Hyphomicrobium sp.]|uniref:class I SAM-dependent methyltransferase n=1 Tax=Hyphomicrobium sp. TaxID=82 RepID=UPI000FA10C7F|nr:class I SAM-dependent methyltransferase [Hyphomicrobium sp.]RUP10347.1 MAG: class I SAM-dependent methyltransferase [Hyphomicrobium sp.]
MSDFSPEWLELREAADVRSRNRNVADAVAARFALRAELSVVDFGAGTGANLRATSALLPERQTWTLVDHETALLDVAKAKLIRWADRHEEDGERLVLDKGGRRISVLFKVADLARDTEVLLDDKPQLVTASAFFDLTSEDYIRKLAKAVTGMGAAFYATLTYNGLQKWTPHRPADNQMTAAFQRHQMRDKGFGPAAGPLAGSHLVDQFRINGHVVTEGESPWRLERGDRMLIDELIRGHAVAVTEIGGVDEKAIVSWLNVTRTAAFVGHTDVFAVPS